MGDNIKSQNSKYNKFSSTELVILVIL